MRIAIIAGPQVSVPPSQYGGTETVIFNLINGLIEQGHEPILLGVGSPDLGCEVIPIVDKPIGFPKSDKQLLNYKIRLAIANKKIEYELKKILHRIDIIHSHGYDLSKFRKFPNITTLHNRVNLDDLPYYLKRKDMPYVSISNNQREISSLLNYTATIYNGEDPKKFKFVKKPDNYVCFLGRFDRDKNPDLAIKLAISQGIKIKVAGKIDYSGTRYFKEEVEPLLSNPLVEYLGELGFDDKVKLISHAKCNLHPTGFREPFGLTVLEAAYCGTPTLAVARGSMPELIEEGRTGMLVEDYVEGFEKLKDCFNLDRSYIAKRAADMFNYKDMANKYVTAYEKVIEKQSNRSKNKILSYRSHKFLNLVFAGLTVSTFIYKRKLKQKKI